MNRCEHHGNFSFLKIHMKKITLLLLSINIFCCKTLEKTPNPKIEIYDDNIKSLIDITAKIEILGDSISLPEGPVWDERNKALLFVDILKNKVLKWDETNGISDYIIPAGNTGYAPNLEGSILGANGLAINSDGELILCQHGDRRLSILRQLDGTVGYFETLVDNYQGSRLNSPNDLTIAKDGTVFFTDPPFGFFDLKNFKFVDSEMRELDFNGVYRFSPNSKELSLITSEIDLPNGVAISPDQKTLYVNKMGMLDKQPKVMKINLDTQEIETFFDGKEISQKLDGNFDGIKVHSSGLVFSSGPGGLLIISPKGKLMGKIDFGHITNCAFDSEEDYLYATGFVSNPKLFRIKLK